MKRYAAAAIALAMLLCGCQTVNSAESSSSENEIEYTFTSAPAIDSAAAVSSEENSDTTAPADAVSDEESKTEYDHIDGEPVDLSWFDDCVFIGDSLTYGLSLYNDYMDCFGNAEFICGASLGFNNCQWDLFDENEVHPTYHGQKVLLEDAVALTGAHKVIIGLGMNDIGNYGIDGTFEGAESFLEKLRSKSPDDLEIYMMTVTPMIEMQEYDILNNDKIVEYDERLEVFCSQHGCKFLNTWSALADENGKLPIELCEDPDQLGIHLNNDGCEILKDYIIRNVGY